MAGDWIKMRIDLFEDPAVIAMADRLDVREEVIVGYLHKVWSWLSRQCHDGSVTGVTLTALGRVTGLPGFPDAMCAVGWLQYDDTGSEPVITVPKFERHLSQSSKKRALASNRKREERSKGVTQVSRTERDKSVTREEKRREEKNTRKDKWQADASHVSSEGDSQGSQDPTGKTAATANDGKPNVTGNSGGNKSSSKAPASYPDWFESIWQAYPPRNGRRRGKPQAYAACRRRGLHQDDRLRDEFATAVAAYAADLEQSGVSARDFERFVRGDWWREYLERPADQTDRPHVSNGTRKVTGSAALEGLL